MEAERCQQVAEQPNLGDLFFAGMRVLGKKIEQMLHLKPSNIFLDFVVLVGQEKIRG